MPSLVRLGEKLGLVSFYTENVNGASEMPALNERLGQGSRCCHARQTLDNSKTACSNFNEAVTTIHKPKINKKLRLHSGKAGHTLVGGTAPGQKSKSARAPRDYRITIRGHLPPDLCERISTVHAAVLSKGCIPFLAEREPDSNCLHRRKAAGE